MAQVQLLDLTKVYPGGIRAVDRVNLTIADREFVVLVGPSGCGKTTTLRMIAGLEEITAGVIQIGGRVVNDLAPKDRDVAMVFQNYALYPHMSVYKNMAFGLKLRGMPKAQIRQRVTDAARVLGIEGLLDRKPRALSGGQRQRVAVGRAIVRDPAAFLFDEPLSNLDAKLRVTTRAELKRLHQRLKTTTIYVTHDQEEAMTLGDRIVVMKDGLIQQADTPLKTYHSPANRFVAGFIGMPPMNFFDGVIMMVGGDMLFREGVASGGGDLSLPSEGIRLPIPARLARRLARWVGRHVVLGVRPEHFLVRPLDTPADSAKVELKVNVVEPLGNDMDVYMSTNLNDHVVARVEAELAQGGAMAGGLRTDAPATFYVDLRKVHVFEPGETGMNLSLTNEPDHAVA
ncbi:MAG TPA: sn-glycerol-3-phosphate ABC transporter ATP-binding protein UgpC [Tepidisphaeraceae bacterium]|jgi:multiple sugar transport system ATP-binding protein